MYRGDICAYKNPKKKGYAVVCLRQVSPRHFQGLHFNSKTNLWNTVTHKIDHFFVAESAAEQVIEYFPEQIPRERVPRPAAFGGQFNVAPAPPPEVVFVDDTERDDQRNWHPGDDNVDDDF